MNQILYRFWQSTWGIFQTILGFILFLKYFKNKHFSYHGAIITEWNNNTSLSLGLFVFVTVHPFFTEKYKYEYTQEELARKLLVHEYGHTIQSLILGPLYLIVIGIPSTLWGFLFAKKRYEKQIPYCAFFTESWANKCGEYVTNEESIGEMIL
ncbi:MAG: hypothetical protein IKI98_04590 [Spirochaetaceae bacterium]|nr:hypothetical protein [Spirochaetaceae bacterium]